MIVRGATRGPHAARCSRGREHPGGESQQQISTLLRVWPLYNYISNIVPALRGTATKSNDGAGTADCDSRRAVGPTKTIRGVYMTQLNRLARLAVLSALREWSFYM